MKKQTIILLILALLTFKGISQTTSDSVTCIPNAQLKKAINTIELYKVQKKDLEITNKKVIQMDSLIIVKDNIISEFRKKSSYQDSIITGYKGIFDNYKKSLANAEITYSLQTIKLKREKFKKYATLIIGVAIGYFIIK